MKTLSAFYVCVLVLMQPMYQEMIRSEGMVQHLVRGLKMENQELQKHCASAIFKVCMYKAHTHLHTCTN